MKYLKIASKFPDTFYGQLSISVLGYNHNYNFETPKISKNFILWLSNQKGGQRGFALLQVKEYWHADREFRKLYPNGKTLIELIRLRFGNKLFKLILLLSIFYMTIFLIAEVTAISILIKYISGTDLWITALIIIFCSLTYTLYGGLRASIFTDNLQFIIIFLLLIICFAYLISFNSNDFNFNFI